MAHIFGEINEPESRAFWDDEELDSSHFQYSLKWIDDNAKPSAIKTLLIVEGSVALDFTKSCTLDSRSKEICVVEHGRLKSSSIHKVNDDLYVCLVSPDLDARHATEFIMTIADVLTSAEKIIAITSQHISSYKSDAAQISPSFLKALRTRSAKFLPYDVESIKQPNLISGIVAAVMSYAEIFDLSAVAYVLYVEEFSLDSETALPLIKLFSTIKGSLVNEPVFKQSSFSKRGNLYM